MLASGAWNSLKSRPTFQKWGAYWKALFRDYKEVGIDTVKDAKENPKKVIAIFAGLGVLGAAFETAPTELSFKEQVVAAGSRLALTSAGTRNPASDAYVRNLYRCENEGLLRHINLGVCSVVWRADFDAATDLYLAQCPYFQPSIVDIARERIVDFGMFGRWFLIERAMKDYDVNDELWDKLEI